MNLVSAIMVGFKEIWFHKFRSLLTMSGIILGVASLLSMFALVAGIARGMREVLQSWGGLERVSVVEKDVSEHLADFAFLSPGKTMADVEAIRRNATLIDMVTAESDASNLRLQVGAETLRAQVEGCLPEYLEMELFAIEHGRALCQLDVDNVYRVANIGASVARELWPDRLDGNVVGETMLIEGVPFTIVGVFPHFETESAKREREAGIAKDMAKRRAERGGRSRRGRWDPYRFKNYGVAIPLTTMIYQFKSAYLTGEDGISWPDYRLSNIFFRIRDMKRFNEAIEQVRAILMGTHRGIDDFGFDTREDQAESIERSIASTRASGGLIAGISLLVGGLGITNIMLASVTQRIREIGVRRAVGARGRDVFIQFIVESTAIGVIGGILGLGASTVMIQLLVALSPTENAPTIELGAAILSFGSAVVIGIVSGIYPAWKAASLDPIEALRYE